jgi:hypothetical protein
LEIVLTSRSTSITAHLFYERVVAFFSFVK